MVGLAWALVAFAAAWAWQRHLLVLVMLVAALWAAMPGIARTSFAIGPIDLHPAATLTLAVFLVQLLRHRQRLVRPLRQAPAIALVVTTVALLALVETLLVSHGPEGVMFGVEQLFCSILLALLVGAAVHDDHVAAHRLTGVLLLVVAVESVWAMVQSLLHRAVLYQSNYETQYWYGDTFDRWMGTLDHPLVLSLVVVLVFPLLARRMNWWLRLAGIVVLGGGMLATQSRTGIALLALEVCYLAVRSRTGGLGRLGLGLGLVISATGAALLGAFTAIYTRLTTDDGGSADARAQALDFLRKNLDVYGWLGQGLGQSFQLASSAGLGTSLESSFIMFVVDMGVPLTLVYFGCMLACIAVGLWRRSTPGAALGALAGFVTVQTFSALGTRNAAGPWLWLVLALALFADDEPLGRRSVLVPADELEEAA